MRMPMKARSIARLSTLVAASSLVLSACSSEVTAPPSTFSPTEANLTQSVRFNPSVGKKLVPNGRTETFVFTINPSVDNTLMMGAHALTIPANIYLLPQPPYAPELNPVKHLWDELREKFFHNLAFDSLDALEDRLEFALRTMEQNQLTVKSIVHWPWIINALLNYKWNKAIRHAYAGSDES